MDITKYMSRFIIYFNSIIFNYLHFLIQMQERKNIMFTYWEEMKQNLQ